jgi:hypothetical protein
MPERTIVKLEHKAMLARARRTMLKSLVPGLPKDWGQAARTWSSASSSRVPKVASTMNSLHDGGRSIPASWFIALVTAETGLLRTCRRQNRIADLQVYDLQVYGNSGETHKCSLTRRKEGTHLHFWYVAVSQRLEPNHASWTRTMPRQTMPQLCAVRH